MYLTICLIDYSYYELMHLLIPQENGGLSIDLGSPYREGGGQWAGGLAIVLYPRDKDALAARSLLVFTGGQATMTSCSRTATDDSRAEVPQIHFLSHAFFGLPNRREYVKAYCPPTALHAANGPLFGPSLRHIASM